MTTKKYSNSVEIGKRIKELRVWLWASQEEIAGLIWINRITLWLLESWKKDIKEKELHKLSEIFEKPKNYFVGEIDIIKEIEKNDSHRKFKLMLLYIVNSVCEKKNVWKTVINKLLYFSDFDYFEKRWENLSEIQYIKWPMWPVPEPNIFEKIKKEMIADNQFEEVTVSYKWFTQIKYISKLSDINYKIIADELWLDGLEVINNVIDRLSHMTATQISEFSHGDSPYIAAESNWEILRKWTVYYRTPQYSSCSEDD